MSASTAFAYCCPLKLIPADSAVSDFHGGNGGSNPPGDATYFQAVAASPSGSAFKLVTPG